MTLNCDRRGVEPYLSKDLRPRNKSLLTGMFALQPCMVLPYGTWSGQPLMDRRWQNTLISNPPCCLSGVTFG